MGSVECGRILTGGRGSGVGAVVTRGRHEDGGGRPSTSGDYRLLGEVVFVVEGDVEAAVCGAAEDVAGHR